MITLFKKNVNLLFLIFTILFVMTVSFVLIKDKFLFADEHQYYEVIKRVTRWEINKELFSRTSSLPGYAFTIGFSQLIFRDFSIAGARLITTIFSLFSITIFYLISKQIDPKNSLVKTLQYFFSPILFIFFFLIYTDVFSLLLILLSFYFLIKGRSSISGLIGLLSLFVRQNNIIWLGFFCFYIFSEKYKYQLNATNLKNYLKDISFFILSFVATSIFFAINKGVTIGSVNQLAQPIGIYLGNIYFALFMFFFLFLPLNISNSQKIFKIFKKKSYFIFTPILIYLVYMLTFSVDHLWNSAVFNFFLRNKLLNLSVLNNLNKSLFFLPIIYALFSLKFVQLHKKSFYSSYVFSLLFLVSLWLVEPRYSIIPFTFFLLFKKERPGFIEYSTIAIYIILSSFIFWGTINLKFFL